MSGLALTACSASSERAPTTLPTTRVSDATALTESLNGLLLGPKDLPSGWETTSESELPSSCATDPPLATIGPFVERAFSRVQNTAIELYESIAHSDSPRSAFSALDRRLLNCRHFTITGQAETIPGTLEPVSFPPYGAQRAGFMLTLDFSTSGLNTPSVSGVSLPTLPKNLLWELGYIIVQKGNYIVDIGYFPSSVDFHPSQLYPYIPLALARIPSSR